MPRYIASCNLRRPSWPCCAVQHCFMSCYAMHLYASRHRFASCGGLPWPCYAAPRFVLCYVMHLHASHHCFVSCGGPPWPCYAAPCFMSCYAMHLYMLCLRFVSCGGLPWPCYATPRFVLCFAIHLLCFSSSSRHAPPCFASLGSRYPTASCQLCPATPCTASFCESCVAIYNHALLLRFVPCTTSCCVMHCCATASRLALLSRALLRTITHPVQCLLRTPPPPYHMTRRNNTPPTGVDSSPSGHRRVKAGRQDLGGGTRGTTSHSNKDPASEILGIEPQLSHASRDLLTGG